MYTYIYTYIYAHITTPPAETFNYSTSATAILQGLAGTGPMMFATAAAGARKQQEMQTVAPQRRISFSAAPALQLQRCKQKPPGLRELDTLMATSLCAATYLMWQRIRVTL